MTEFDVPTRLGRIRVRDVGEGPPAVLWHSMFVDSGSWDRIVPGLAGRRRLFIVDAPWCGASEKSAAAADIEACADAAREIIATVGDVCGAEAVDWVGNAWGGHVGMHLAAVEPERINTLVAMSAPTRPIDRALRRRIGLLLPMYRVIGARGPVWSAISTTLFTDRTRSDDPEAIAVLRRGLRASGRSMIPAIRTAILNRTDLTWAAARITCPVLFVTTDDRGEWTPEEAREVAATMLDAREVTIREARVIPALEQPGQTVDAVLDFWAQKAEESPLPATTADS
ncbi:MULTISPECIES: alpha/beta fold hydrolase [Gordonia]|jgi:pimeloyl-ACP methyl ester carboxylesterase|uniref:AB hydrolase-1 domain-containing protein n=2 Tax=Gordonia alkanivorans TaxID=84096 RepID=F9VT49_9ACTN|nr:MULTISPECIES: alpha/beta hydrolase [Gordonia]ETA08054.1 hydrolase [Gordonia alkanivorans CGMCC 6845]MDH3018830.1 alpha/beta hydrolase [Gordonia alkanivorans]MDJ0006887.1 alpha/beta hydrolase [Gordonia alkanivorans]MDJ0096993.1 alpha/beta hydrolase [Gordonia alkanivorans]MDJ0492722.1 alpha/beta hydrolase [Gordonia alkanivorans]